MGIPPTVVSDAASGTHVGKSHLTPRHADSTFAGGSFFKCGNISPASSKTVLKLLFIPSDQFIWTHKKVHNEKAPEKALRGFGTFFLLE